MNQPTAQTDDLRRQAVQAFANVGDAFRSATESIRHFHAAYHAAGERCERDAFWNHPGSVRA